MDIIKKIITSLLIYGICQYNDNLKPSLNAKVIERKR